VTSPNPAVPSILARLGARLKRRARPLWQIHPPVALVVRASGDACVQTLLIAAKPSQQRLHLRDLFTDGRRYYIQPREDGFRLTSDTKLFWGGKRRRTRMAAVIYGAFAGGGDEVTFVRLRARMSVFYSLRSLLIPVFVSSILIYTPWSLPVVTVLIVLLFTLSWLGHRFDAAYQANEMVYFVQKALEDLPPAEMPQLQAAGPDVVVPSTAQEFREQWQKFYREHTQDER
jgi:hypothetical protein